MCIRDSVSASYDAEGNPTLDVGDAILVLRQIVGLTAEFPAQSAAFFTCFSLDLPGETVQIDPAAQTITPVSYTHLDVYKRQLYHKPPANWSIPLHQDATRTNSSCGYTA